MGKKRFVVFVIPVIILVVITAFFFRGFIFNKLAAKMVLRAGQPMKFGAYTVFIDRIEDNKLFGIKITDKDRKLQAQGGAYEYLPKENAIRFNLVDGVAEDADPKNPDAFQRLTFKQLYLKIRLKSLVPK